jgi:hypothetical protein
MAMIKSQIIFLVILPMIIAALWMTGCEGTGAYVQAKLLIDFYLDEGWVFQAEFQVPTYADEAIREIELQIQKMSLKASEQNAQFSQDIQEDGSYRKYLVYITGAGLNKLSKIVFDEQASIYLDVINNRQTIRFSHNWMPISGVDVVFNVRGARILTGNGEYSVNTDGRTVTLSKNPPWGEIKPK